jgi:hypothetical protein
MSIGKSKFAGVLTSRKAATPKIQAKINKNIFFEAPVPHHIELSQICFSWKEQK